MSDDDRVRFVGRPRVIGSLGPRDPLREARIRRLHRWAAVHERQDVVLLMTIDAAPPGGPGFHGPPGVVADGVVGTPYRDASGQRAWVFGSHQPEAPSDWRQAALSWDAPGLADLGDRVVLHAGAVGFLDLFTRRIGDSLWFASRMADLLALDDEPMAVDWEAWACTLVLGCPVGDATPFQAIRRLEGAAAHVLERSTGVLRHERWDPPWVGLDEVAPDAGDPGAVWDVARALVRRLPAGPIALPLSGGFDSRLMLLALRDAGRIPRLWSTDKDDGLADMAITAELAGHLGQPVEVVRHEPGMTGQTMLTTMARVEHMVPLHWWMTPLGSALHADGLPIADALAAATAIKGAFQERAVAARDAGVDWRPAVLETLQRQSPDGAVLDTQVSRWAFPTARGAWMRAADQVRGDANEVTLVILRSRTTRAIANLSHWIFGPEVRVDMPFAHPDLLRVGFQAGYRRRADGGFYREVLRIADPVIGPWRTTHDPAGAIPEPSFTRTDEATRRWVIEQLPRAEVVPGLVAPGLRRFLETGHRSAPPARRWPWQPRGPHRRTDVLASYRMARTVARSLHLVLLGDWIGTHRDRLTSLEPPWMDREDPGLPD